MSKEEWFDLSIIEKFDKGFKNKEFDEEMALGLLNKVQEHWCGSCDNYKRSGHGCGCYFPDFKKEMIRKIKEHFNPQAYKFEDLKVGMWVWDVEFKDCIKIKIVFEPCNLYPKGSLKAYHDLNEEQLNFIEFEENRFFPVQMANLRR